MLKNPVILSLLVILVCISCTTDKNSKTALEGTWIASYSQTANNVKNNFKDIPDYIHLMDFNGDSVRLKSFNDKNSRSYIDTIVNFSLTDGAIKLGDEEEMQIAITTDSIVLSSEVHNQRYQDVFRKLPKNPKIVNWNPKGSLYKTQYGEEIIYIDFVTDTSMYSFKNKASKYEKTTWKIEKVGNYNFLAYDRGKGMEIKYSLVDSVKNNKVYLRDFYYEDEKYEFEELVNTHNKPEKLFGKWRLISKKELTKEEENIKILPPRIDIYKLHINKDSILMIHPQYNSTYTYDWKYYESAKIIVLDSKNSAIKVSKITKDSLALIVNPIRVDFITEELVFIRE